MLDSNYGISEVQKPCEQNISTYSKAEYPSLLAKFAVKLLECSTPGPSLKFMHVSLYEKDHGK